MLEETESSGGSHINGNSMSWCRSDTYHFSTHLLAETSHTAPPNHEVSRKCNATLSPEGGRTGSTCQAALITTMQVKCHAMSRRKSKAKLLSLFLSLGKYQPEGKKIFASDYLCFLINVKNPTFSKVMSFFGMH